MDWNYVGELSLTVAIFAPGLILIAMYFLLRPFSGRLRAPDPVTEGEKLQLPLRDVSRGRVLEPVAVTDANDG